jgi:molybdopterin-guanine dinucleotide biosynthesis protein A
MTEASAIILAGGKNTRIGKNKAFIQLPTGETILQNTLNVLQKIFPEIIIVTNQKEAYLNCNAQANAGSSRQVVEDLIKERGPLGGIFTGLCYSTAKRNFVVACDMPFVNPAVIRLLLDEGESHDVAIPEIDGEVEPLFAVYSKNCMPVMFEHLQKQNLKMRELLSKLKVKKVKAEDIDQIDPQHLCFFNVNTHEDLQRALNLKTKRSDAK